ncbi:uncharacterized protein N7469_004160 [Penicillium citrinum]|uniref:Hypervirulence associated protein TUDOR domain-containing protein n=2 Tax=Penicillium TaxID=5073 RepID=A0A9W9P459_PENCI|nr:uncharacterized protein N7469_004160 [Penicillium citrinum]KAJ5234992.1 hypothetical protein N7469_004160 [Penicillium citrinum]KAJ5590610.1 hypothetical protein N7450_004582 [Penicillium hetheringtonii]
MPHFKEGQRVNYKPVGGPNSNTNSSVGIIHNVCTSKVHLDRPYCGGISTVENEKTHKRSAVKEKNIMGPAE